MLGEYILPTYYLLTVLFSFEYYYVHMWRSIITAYLSPPNPPKKSFQSTSSYLSKVGIYFDELKNIIILMDAKTTFQELAVKFKDNLYIA